MTFGTIRADNICPVRAKLGLSASLAALLALTILPFGATAAPDPDDETPSTDVTASTDAPTDTDAPSGTDAPSDTADDTTTTESTTTSSTTLAPFPGAVGDEDTIDISDLGSPTRPGSTFQTEPLPPPPTTTTTTLPDPTILPPSGTGRRAVYSKSAQRVWAVDADGTVLKTHRVSGKLTWCDPRPGTYSVWSRSRYTYAIQNPTIKWGYMVRFTKGCNGGNIGFHEIPTQYGAPVQSVAQLGQPLSGGCVRQAVPDAIWMWNWAQIGTKVVVLP